PAEDRMGMTVSEGRHEEAAVEVDVLDRVLIRRQSLQVTVHLVGADRGDDTLSDEEGFGGFGLCPRARWCRCGKVSSSRRFAPRFLADSAGRPLARTVFVYVTENTIHSE